eukprot:TRINITY_DN8301_c0_g1_i1.p1 TRINITY_DN8301_c0_g1~~TRINITY_DN8301_c0_g1_i1.p1  ORF type:complete len:227 (+),score=12.09 TRINITY_DN8301_c0_g1_i1:74-682(+)
MASTLRPATVPASMGKSWSSPALHDWTSEWDADVTLGAAPRYTFGECDKGDQIYDPCLHWPFPKKKQTRDSYLDKTARHKAWVPGAGTHRKLREFSPEPPKEEGVNDPNYSLGKLRDRAVPKVFSRSTRPANLKDIRQILVRPDKHILLPSSFFSPGPGEYTAYSSFGSPSGPTRKRYFATNGADNTGKSRPAEKFGVNSER